MTSPVTITVCRETSPERLGEAIEWIDRGLALARGFDGYLGGGVMRDAQQDHLLHVVYRFRDRHSLDQWDHSEARRHWSQSGMQLASVASVQRRTGIEGWFDGPRIRHTIDPENGQAKSIGVRSAPPRWKQATAIWLGMVPINLTASWVLTDSEWWQQLPLTLRSLLLVTLQVTLMTFFVMPAVTRMLRTWLRRNPGIIKSERALREALAAEANRQEFEAVAAGR